MLRDRLSGIVASELFDRGSGNGAYKRKSFCVECSQFLGSIDDTIKTIICEQMLPVLILAVFQYSFDNVWCIGNRINGRPVHIPEDVVRKALYALFLRHIFANIQKRHKKTPSAGSFVLAMGQLSNQF